MPDDPLRHPAKESAELIAVVDRGDALRQALALLIDESEVAWAACPTGTDTLRIEHLVGNKTTRPYSLPVPQGAGLSGKVYVSGRLERVDDYFASQWITHSFDSHIAVEKMRRLLAVPLAWQGKTLGVLAVGPRATTEFSATESSIVPARWQPGPRRPSRTPNVAV